MTKLVTGPLLRSDVAELARIHRAAFPGFFLSTLGEPFLRQFYQGFLGDHGGIAVVLREAKGGRPLGAAVGPLEPAGFFIGLLRRRMVPFVVASAAASLRSPRSLPRLLQAVRYRGQGGTSAPGALLSSICVSPHVRGSGAGSTLLHAWELEVASRGCTSAHLTTDADDNALVNAFYDRRGWPVLDTFITREGRRMHLRSRSPLPQTGDTTNAVGVAEPGRPPRGDT